MTSMIERVARALADRDGYDWTDMPPYHDGYMEAARTAIAAFRNPTEAMVEAGAICAYARYKKYFIGGDGETNERRWNNLDAAHRAGWRAVARAALIAAVDEALADKQEPKS